MNGYTLVLLSAFALSCRGANTTFVWSSGSKSEKTHGGYVAAGLGMRASETTSGLATTTSNDLTSSSTSTTDSIFRDRTSEDANLTTAVLSGRISENVHTTTNSTNATSTIDCWDSWLDYWSASSANRVTYTTSSYAPRTVTNTELHRANTYFDTSSWESWVYTATDTALSTIYSDGYPVSVHKSYDTRTWSNVGWTTYTTWKSLSDYHTTFTETWSFYDYITTTRSPSALPTPSCELPTTVSDCNKQWSSYIYSSGWKYWDELYTDIPGSFPGTPDCTQARVTGDWCTSMMGYYFARETMYGQADDVGWKTTDGTRYFPASKSLAPGCSLGCQACSITGESVQLLYWPPSTATLVENGTGTATLTPFANSGAGLRTVVFDGEHKYQSTETIDCSLNFHRYYPHIAHDLHLLRYPPRRQFLWCRRKNIQKHNSSSPQHQPPLQP